MKSFLRLALLVTTVSFGWQMGLWAACHGLLSETVASHRLALLSACALGGLSLGGLLLLLCEGAAEPAAGPPKAAPPKLGRPAGHVARIRPRLILPD